jgi:predicted RNA-binding protein with PUA-like domain
MPQYWLLKTEPGTYSFEDLEREGRAIWDGVTNNLALKNMRAMQRGDQAFIYHTGVEKSVVGVAEVVSDPYPDPKSSDPRLTVVDLQAKRRLPAAVPLSEIKARRDLAEFPLVRLPRLSVVPVTEDQWRLLLEMSEK